MLTAKLGDKGDNVRAVQRALNSLAYVLKVDGDFGPATSRAVMQFQHANGLAQTGDAGTETVACLGRKVPAEMPLPPAVNAIEVAGRAALAHALNMWGLDIRDPRVDQNLAHDQFCKQLITSIILRNGWGWRLREDGGDGTYRGNGPPQWCGMFAGFCWAEAGLDTSWLAHFWASTRRLAKWFRYQKWNEHDAGTKPATGGRMIINPAITPMFPDGSPVRAGDIGIVGDGAPDEGDHITMIEAVTTLYGRSIYHTVSGNGGGVGPTGKPREGISKQDYRTDRGGYRMLWVGRPGVGDLVVR